mmetsp:Transcript_13812/g.48140  ORF Transcript_13812/g.48140 Transcript_13812/m.48140 type:complete len:312 (-) Transcript_13812:1409-2344(-)
MRAHRCSSSWCSSLSSSAVVSMDVMLPPTTSPSSTASSGCSISVLPLSLTTRRIRSPVNVPSPADASAAARRTSSSCAAPRSTAGAWGVNRATKEPTHGRNPPSPPASAPVNCSSRNCSALDAHADRSSQRRRSGRAYAMFTSSLTPTSARDSSSLAPSTTSSEPFERDPRPCACDAPPSSPSGRRWRWPNSSAVAMLTEPHRCDGSQRAPHRGGTHRRSSSWTRSMRNTCRSRSPGAVRRASSPSTMVKRAGTRTPSVWRVCVWKDVTAPRPVPMTESTRITIGIVFASTPSSASHSATFHASLTVEKRC